MKNFFGKVRLAEPQVSDAERELFGGPLRYDMGWSQHEHAGLDLTMGSALRQMPTLVGATLRMAWRADRRALVAVAISEIAQGVAAAVSLLAVNAVMHALLGTGSAVERLHALLPGLLAAAGVAVVNSALVSWSTSGRSPRTAGRADRHHAVPGSGDRRRTRSHRRPGLPSPDRHRPVR